LGAEVNQARGDGAMALHIGAERSHESVVRALIEAGADVNKADGNGVTPLMCAAHNGHTAIV
jgi:ankyrin repeat protein